MQISKTFLVVCTVLGFAGSVCFAAPDSLSQAQAREALREKIAELNAQKKAGQPASAPAKAAPIVKSPNRKSADLIKAEEEAAAAAEKQRQADEAKATQKAAAEAKVRKTKSGKAKPDAVTNVTPAAFAPVAPPPPTVSASKEAKLADLLGNYKADAITPEEYHKERAKILVEP